MPIVRQVTWKCVREEKGIKTGTFLKPNLKQNIAKLW